MQDSKRNSMELGLVTSDILKTQQVIILPKVTSILSHLAGPTSPTLTLSKSSSPESPYTVALTFKIRASLSLLFTMEVLWDIPIYHAMLLLNHF